MKSTCKNEPILGTRTTLIGMLQIGDAADIKSEFKIGLVAIPQEPWLGPSLAPKEPLLCQRAKGLRSSAVAAPRERRESYAGRR
jgi:hypothetical protein